MFNCMWKHCCDDETLICCHFCKKKCEWRCNDSKENCIYKESAVNFREETDKNNIFMEKKVKIKTHNEIVEKTIQEKLRKYKKENKIKEDELSSAIGVSVSIVSKIISSRSSVKVRSDSYKKIKEFIKSIKNAEKRNLW